MNSFMERSDQTPGKAELELTASIQLRLMPQQLPEVAGIEIYARSQPAALVGGDFYMFRHHVSGQFVLVVGDVSGKGLPAALLMVMTHTALRGVTRFLPQLSPQAVVNRVNEDLYDDFTETGMFVTAFVACYDPSTRNLAYANAGHSPIIYSPVQGPTQLLHADSPPIGVLPMTTGKNFSLPLMPGDVLVLATDGFNEAQSTTGEQFGCERLCLLIEANKQASSQGIAESCFAEVSRFASGYHSQDDQTIVVVKGRA